jgi:alkyl hydroperoxide reductase subunit F
MYECIIIGGGPAGTAAAVYAARKKLRSAIITKDFGGQSVVSDDIQNWIGSPHISGQDLAKSLEAHVREYADDVLDIKTGESVARIEKDGDTFSVTTEAGTYQTRTVLITTGSERRKLSIPGAAEFEHKGLTYCASCDGPLFTDKDVAVIGGGNAGFETAAQLLAYAKSVTLLDYGEEFKAEKITVDKVLSHSNMQAHHNAETVEVIGDIMVSGLRYKDRKTGEEHTLDVQGIFVEIGQMPATGIAGDLIERTDYGQIKIDPRTQRSSHPGVWAAGDCTDVLYHQNNIAAGDAVRAMEDIYVSLHAS